MTAERIDVTDVLSVRLRREPYVIAVRTAQDGQPRSSADLRDTVGRVVTLLWVQRTRDGYDGELRRRLVYGTILDATKPRHSPRPRQFCTVDNVTYHEIRSSDDEQMARAAVLFSGFNPCCLLSRSVVLCAAKERLARLTRETGDGRDPASIESTLAPAFSFPVVPGQ